MNQITITIGEERVQVERGTNLAELANNYQSNFKYEIILAKVNGIYQELTYTIHKDCKVEFLDLTERGANRVFLNGLIYLTIYATKQLFGSNMEIKVNHSLDKGLYIETNIGLTEEDLTHLELKMKEIIAADLPITKVTVTRLDAKNYFQAVGDEVKSGIMGYITSTHVTLYKIGDL